MRLVGAGTAAVLVCIALLFPAAMLFGLGWAPAIAVAMALAGLVHRRRAPTAHAAARAPPPDGPARARHPHRAGPRRPCAAHRHRRARQIQRRGRHRARPASRRPRRGRQHCRRRGPPRRQQAPAPQTAPPGLHRRVRRGHARARHRDRHRCRARHQRARLQLRTRGVPLGSHPGRDTLPTPDRRTHRPRPRFLPRGLLHHAGHGDRLRAPRRTLAGRPHRRHRHDRHQGRRDRLRLMGDLGHRARRRDGGPHPRPGRRVQPHHARRRERIGPDRRGHPDRRRRHRRRQSLILTPVPIALGAG
jgi:hypothetical protein